MATQPLQRPGSRGPVRRWHLGAEELLAGVYHEISQTHGKAAAASFMSKLAPHMSAPIDKATISGQLWINCGSTEAFIDGGRAPGARSQQVKDAVASIAGWIDNPPTAL